MIERKKVNKDDIHGVLIKDKKILYIRISEENLINSISTGILSGHIIWYDPEIKTSTHTTTVLINYHKEKFIEDNRAKVIISLFFNAEQEAERLLNIILLDDATKNRLASD